MTGAPIDLLYRLTRRDEAFPHWGPNFGRIDRLDTPVTFTTTLAEWDASLAPPAGTILFITRLTGISQPNVATTETRDLTVNLVDRESGLVIAELMRFEGPPVLFPDRVVLRDPFDFAIVMDRHFLQISGTWNFATFSKNLILAWTGFVVPQGEIGFS